MAAFKVKTLLPKQLFAQRISYLWKIPRNNKSSRFVSIPLSRKEQVAKAANVMKRINWENLYLFGPLLHDETKIMSKQKTDSEFEKQEGEMVNLKLGDLYDVTDDLCSQTVDLTDTLNEDNENTPLSLPLYPFTINSKDSFANDLYLKTRATDILQGASERDMQIENIQLPTVSTILHNSTSNAEKLKERQIMVSIMSQYGWHHYSKHNKNLYHIDKALRDCMELFFSPLKKDVRLPEIVTQYWNSMLPFLYTLSNAKVNQKVIHPYLNYSGVTDCIAVWQDHVVLIEIILPYNKSSLTRNLEDAPLRAAAYAGALNADLTNGIEISEVLFVCPSSNKSLAQVHCIEYDKVLAYWNVWLKRLKTYWEMRCENSVLSHVNVSYK